MDANDYVADNMRRMPDDWMPDEMHVRAKVGHDRLGFDLTEGGKVVEEPVFERRLRALRVSLWQVAEHRRLRNELSAASVDIDEMLRGLGVDD